MRIQDCLTNALMGVYSKANKEKWGYSHPGEWMASAKVLLCREDWKISHRGIRYFLREDTPSKSINQSRCQNFKALDDAVFPSWKTSFCFVDIVKAIRSLRFGMVKTQVPGASLPNDKQIAGS